ncbi:MAG: CPBP family glutamic-type intramembrane protease [Pseudomonadota bacterium]
MSADGKRLLLAERVARSTGFARRRRLGALALAALGVACAGAGLISFEPPAHIVSETGFAPHRLKALSIIQVSILTICAAALGYWATPRLGLYSIIVDGIPRLSASMLVFLIIGMGGGVASWAVDAALVKRLPLLEAFQSAHDAQLTGLEALANPTMRLAYGGVTEEILVRYGLFSGMAVAAGILLKHRISALGFAAILSSALFGVGHLPAILAFVPDAPTLFLIKTVVLNTAVASLFAMVFVLHSLEASMATHAGFHLALLALGRL